MAINDDDDETGPERLVDERSTNAAIELPTRIDLFCPEAQAQRWGALSLQNEN